MYIRKVSENSKVVPGRPKSLEFLHKPQRVSQPRLLYPDESLKRNTDMNRGKVSVEEEIQHHNGGNVGNDENGPLDMTQPSPPPQLDTSMGTVIEPTVDLQSYFPAYHETDMPLVRKKSGEIVRPSLKQGHHHQRSKSLPATPSDREVDKILYGPPLRPKRSKSVHFDQRDVVSVKYFWKDDSPLDVAAQDVQEDDLHLRTNRPSPYDFWLRAETTVQDDANPTALDQTPIDMTMALSNLHLDKRQHSGLRRSKRYQKLKSREATQKGSGTAGNDGDVDHVHTSQLSPGLHHENFAILTTTNRMSLKLNVFLSIAHHCQCFLQEISLLGNQQYLVGKVLVKNIFYDKKVVVRYTWDRWRTVHEVESVWVSTGDDLLPGMNMDKFKFVIDVISGSDQHEHKTGHVTHHTEFCIQYTSRNGRTRMEYWDNNSGRNYALDVVATPRMGFTDPFGGQA